MLPASHFWFTGSALFTIGSFALSAILGFLGIAAMTANYRRWVMAGYAAAFILFLIGWWQSAKQEEVSAKRDTDFESMQSDLSKIANSANVSLNQSASEIAAAVIKKIEPLQQQIDKLSNPPREILYRGGRVIARVAGINLDQAQQNIKFGAVSAEREIDFGGEFEFQWARIFCKSDSGKPSQSVGFGAVQTLTYSDVSCRTLGPRN
jgi:hypothetical protein